MAGHSRAGRRKAWPCCRLQITHAPSPTAPTAPPRRHVRRAAVQVLSTAAHTKPALVVEHLPAALPLLYAQTAVNKALIRTVDLGPFKHQIDDGLELRKVRGRGGSSVHAYVCVRACVCVGFFSGVEGGQGWVGGWAQDATAGVSPCRSFPVPRWRAAAPLPPPARPSPAGRRLLAAHPKHPSPPTPTTPHHPGCVRVHG